MHVCVCMYVNKYMGHNVYMSIHVWGKMGACNPGK